jgi:hypothetical protein
MSEYTEQAEKFLTDHNLTFRAVYVGEDCPPFCEDSAKGNLLVPRTFPRTNHIHGSHWRLTISGTDRGHLSVDFWDSYNSAIIRWVATHSLEASRTWVNRNYGRGSQTLAEKYAKEIRADRRRIPTAYDMLTSITKNEPEMFEDFARDYGYDSDSRKAESIYQSVVKEWRMVSRFFTPGELAEAQEIQ